MTVTYLKLAAITVSVIMSSSALACLEVVGHVDAGIRGVDGILSTVDNGAGTCSGDISDGDNNVDCISGYSLNYDFSDNDPNNFPITYCNPQNCYGITVPTDGEYPSWKFDYKHFCG